MYTASGSAPAQAHVAERAFSCSAGAKKRPGLIPSNGIRLCRFIPLRARMLPQKRPLFFLPLQSSLVLLSVLLPFYLDYRKSTRQCQCVFKTLHRFNIAGAPFSWYTKRRGQNPKTRGEASCEKYFFTHDLCLCCDEQICRDEQSGNRLRRPVQKIRNGDFYERLCNICDFCRNYSRAYGDLQTCL